MFVQVSINTPPWLSSRQAMNKKQLRMIKKTQVNVQTGAVELVSPWQTNGAPPRKKGMSGGKK